MMESREGVKSSSWSCIGFKWLVHFSWAHGLWVCHFQISLI